MSDWRAWLMTLFFIVGAVAACVLVMFAFTLFKRIVAAIRYRPRFRKMDYTNMMILFQSMRDILEEQKKLARQLTEGLDKRITHIRETVDAARAELDTLRKNAEELAEELAVLRSKKQTEIDLSPAPRAPSPPLAFPETKALEPPVRGNGNAHSPNVPTPLRVVARPKETARFNDVIENWVGLDFGEDVPDPHAFDVPETEPDAPEDPDAAREAFRSLLSYQEEAPAALHAHPQSVAVPAGNNGAPKMTPLQARVYEYSDAGMTVPTIAQELGIGKGEVRLILSLRKDKGH